ncbi:MAG TPA: trypsin-like peptidase domain-containing protein [Streptosporangiaceae bacterium]|nr:trypsin-like peptidase domain-containing protein [Streptosporangiaceae bacterium]
MQDYSGYGQPPSGPTMPMPPMPPRPPRRRVGALSYLLVALAAGALGAGSVVALYHPTANNTSQASPQPSSGALKPAPPSSAVPSQPGSGSPSTSAGEQAIVNKVAPGLVIINTTLQYNSAQAAATGMVINPDGLVLTNNHVIEDSTSITARTANGQQYRAKVLGYDVTGDIALIQLQGASGLTTVPIGNSSSLKTGDSVVGMGNAEGQNAIVPVTGQVTALNQTITAGDEGGSVTQETLHDMIQTNADIVSGDSGGPLANSAGEVIGMDTAGNDGGFAVQQDSSGYAIPIENALAVAQQIRQGQASSTVVIGYPPFMGVYIGQGSNSDPQAQAQLQNGGNGTGFGGFGGNGNQNCYTSDQNLVAPANIANVNSGTLIIGTICGGPAMAAGMTAGSVITAVNGQAIGAPASLTGVVSKFKPGTTIKVSWVSPSGQRSTSSIKLTAGPPL